VVHGVGDSANKDEWVKNVKRRIKTLYRKKVGTRDYESFVNNLDQMGLVRILRCRDCKNYDPARTQDDPKATPCKENRVILDPNVSFCDLIDTPEIRIWRQAIEERKREKNENANMDCGSTV
jgi:hypothetical protein